MIIHEYIYIYEYEYVPECLYIRLFVCSHIYIGMTHNFTSGRPSGDCFHLQSSERKENYHEHFVDVDVYSRLNNFNAVSAARDKDSRSIW